ncbi:MAG TPA: 2-oxoacid:acceptor oxidoreductase subunit alpha [Halanaerobiales bacterium]|nr:2-oxoacid:acceptor oxidoreductase subunit alpha [Halanaerobiales bacterium]
MDFNILIGGEAGQGLKTVDNILGKILFREGFNIFSSKDFMSRIRGGHNFMQLRISDEKLYGPDNDLDLLIALNKESVDIHREQLKDDGIILIEGDEEVIDGRTILVPASVIANDINPKGINTVFVGAALKIMDLDLDKAKQVVKEYFDEDLVEDNIKLLERGYKAVDPVYEKLKENVSDKSEEVFIDGNSALGYGALTGGLRFYSAYPMSPSTGIMNFLAGQQENFDIVVEQAEDELAALNMALGGSYSGIRSMSGTSGGGLALMNEAIGLAGITETPVVVADVQRPGPATGLPTRTGQGDLLFAINSAQDEFPLMVIAPRDQKDLFYNGFRALNIADKYQIPVIILSDQFNADSSKNIEEFHFDSLTINRYLISEDDPAAKDYKRYKFTEDGISPRAYPGQLKGETVLVDSDEHDEEGHIVEDGETRTKMVDKRARKLDKLIQEDLQEPKYFGDEDIDYLLLTWGSSYGPTREAFQLLKEDGIKVGLLSFNDVWPLPKEQLEDLACDGVDLITVELNSTAQFGTLIASETLLDVKQSILKYDGRPFTGKEIYNRFLDEVIDNG